MTITSPIVRHTESRRQLCAGLGAHMPIWWQPARPRVTTAWVPVVSWMPIFVRRKSNVSVFPNHSARSALI